MIYRLRHWYWRTIRYRLIDERYPSRTLSQWYASEPQRGGKAEPPVEYFSAEQMLLAGWESYMDCAYSRPHQWAERQRELMEFRTPDCDSKPWTAYARDLAPQTNTTNLWWREPRVLN